MLVSRGAVQVFFEPRLVEAVSWSSTTDRVDQDTERIERQAQAAGYVREKLTVSQSTGSMKDAVLQHVLESASAYKHVVGTNRIWMKHMEEGASEVRLVCMCALSV